MSNWLLSLENPDYFYYYTPCGNRQVCTQGNQNTASNVVQYKPGINQCEYYLSIDHHQQAKYSVHLGAWYFSYSDGQICQQTNEPRTTTIYYNCDEELEGAAWFYAAEEYSNCNYALQLKSPLACVPENQINAQCQWQYTNPQINESYSLDLSSLKGQTIYASEINNNNETGYVHYFSPCANDLMCYQQSNNPKVMSMIENSKTGSCDHFLSIWEDGRVQPFYYNDSKHWTFHYFSGEKCPNGQIGQETIRFYCDQTVDDYKVLNATYDGDCFWELNIASKLACQQSNKPFKY